MINRITVQKALKQTLAVDYYHGYITDGPADGHSRIISKLIYDIYGGEILKTHNNKNWHFYNRIDGKRMDFTVLKEAKYSKGKLPEDLPSTSEETHYYFAQEDYLILFMRFIRAFEEVVGLKKFRIKLTA
jgi:hypothetical protein